MAGQIRVDEITNEAGTGAPSFPNRITPASLGTGTPSNVNYLRGDGSWQVPPAGFSGAESITSANDVTLTAQSPQALSITMTQAGRRLILPNATTLTPGGDIYRVYNNGFFSFDIVNSAGTLLQTALPAFGTAGFTLVRNPTAAGVWARAPLSTAIRVTATSPVVQEAFTGEVVRVDTNTFVAVQSGNPYTLRAGTLSNGVITWGTPVTFTVTDTYVHLATVRPGVALLCSSNSINAYGTIAPTRAYVRPLVITGNSISVGSQTTVHSFQQSNGAVGDVYWTIIDGGTLVCCANAYNSIGGSPIWRTKIISTDTGGNISLSSDITGNVLQPRSGISIANNTGLFNVFNTATPSQNGVAVVTFSGTSHTVNTVNTSSGAGVDGGFYLYYDGNRYFDQQISFVLDSNTVRARSNIWTLSGNTVVSQTAVTPAIIGSERYLSNTTMLFPPVANTGNGASLQLLNNANASPTNSDTVVFTLTNALRYFKLTDNSALVVRSNMGTIVEYFTAGVA